MKTYEVVDLTGDSYLNPVGAAYGDGSGTHQRGVGAITSISIHHDAVDRPHDYDSVARYRNEAATHYQRLGPGLQYHYKIDNTGTIFRIRPLTTWLYVVGSSENVSCIAICLDGNFENQQPTGEQGEALFQLLLDLCTQHPDFPATWPDVRPHADYSSTACCGANLRGHIFPIQDQASATAQLVNQWPYDWPEYQPSTPAPTPETPVPTPPTTTISYRVFKDGKQIGAYSKEENAWGKYRDNPGSVVKDQNGNDITAQLVAKYDPPKPPTPTPPEQDHAVNDRLNALEALVQKIVEFLSSIFSGFKK